MINFRLPWYTLLLGPVVFAGACLLPLGETLRLPIALVAIMLLLDGSLGLRILPRLTPFASFPDDWRSIERELYFGELGITRASAAIMACTALAVCGSVFGTGDWLGWCAVTIIVMFGIGWFFAALKAIRDTIGNGS
jgi:hypothetical protein